MSKCRIDEYGNMGNPIDSLAGKQVENEDNHPSRYNGNTEYECYKVLRQWMNPVEYRGFLRGNAIKYLCRLGKKDEMKKELKKAQWYINQLIEELENEK